MVFKGSSNIESIFFHPAGDSEEVHWIDLTMRPDSNTFMVTCCCGEDWNYEFIYTKSDYERIKYTIMQEIFEADSVEEVMETLDEIFTDGFEDILINDDCEEFANEINCTTESKYVN